MESSIKNGENLEQTIRKTKIFFGTRETLRDFAGTQYMNGLLGQDLVILVALFECQMKIFIEKFRIINYTVS